MKSALEIALERSQKIWEKTTPEELQDLEMQNQAEQIIGQYLKGDMTLEQLIEEVKKAENAREMIRFMQRHLLDCIRIKTDIKPLYDALIALESEKDPNNKKRIKYIFDYEIMPLMEQYDMVVEDARKQITVLVKRKAEMAVEKLKEQFGRQGMTVVVDDINNISIENSPEWIQFTAENDSKFNQVLSEHINHIKDLL